MAIEAAALESKPTEESPDVASKPEKENKNITEGLPLPHTRLMSVI